MLTVLSLVTGLQSVLRPWWTGCRRKNGRRGGNAARRGQDPTAALDEALALAIQTGEAQFLVPVAAARASPVHREAHGLVADEIYPVAEGA
ncbi:MAG TPA: hypothetical protein VGS19_05440 [Streptosporangiaceae bacterium]|nr:hypothetical protein [Streptosporangiaceae bacterium]